MSKLNLAGEKRKISGKKVKRLREEGIIPANIYGKKIKSLAVQIKLDDFLKLFKESGETGLVEFKLGSEIRHVLVHNIQKDPLSGLPLHIDLLQVNLKEKVVAEVPVEVIGESPAEKQGIGTLVQYINEIEVEALPTDLPEKFEIDASKFAEIDQSYLVKDIKVNKEKIEIKTDSEQIIIKVEAQKKEEEVEIPKPEVTEEAPVEGEVKEQPQTEQQQEEAPKEEK
ncbi:hypothetical protein A2159_00275 [Candidatus Woesebacteria bacterium RBG_13_34_9]|uniref:Large ribosomal subunit protein bL25 n=1 Tax=Candidatus Woesebacteria bacterium RBG_13_34_9 TaxID=1802477 RepID=A0A1F7X3I4_9BACT|nr:MAG: hypothetical protein A2159_00275 [Candidatus Woesebacteria bacterium RBG_13_34_9]